MSAAAEAVDAAVELCAAAMGLYHLLGHPDDSNMAEGKREAVLGALAIRADDAGLFLTRGERSVLTAAVESATCSDPGGNRRREARAELFHVVFGLCVALTGMNPSEVYIVLSAAGALDDREGRRFVAGPGDSWRPVAERLLGLALPCETAAERLYSRLGSSHERLDNLLSD